MSSVRRTAAVSVVLFVAIILGSCATEVDVTPAQDSNPAATEEPAASSTDPTPAPSESDDHSADPEHTPAPEPESDDESETPEPTPVDDDKQSDPEPTPMSEPEPIDLPSSAFLENMTHVYQTWNNCSAASTCMLLSFYDIYVDQEALRPLVRPNDDAKHGKYERIIAYLHEQGLRATLMHGGDVETLQAFLANDIPVIVQQWLEMDSDPIGHYRVVRGYDDERGIFRVNDSMFGGDVPFTYAEFDEMWRAFSYRYIPVYPPEKQDVVDRILGEQIDHDTNRERTVERIERELEDRPDDAELWFSLGTNLHDLGRDAEAVEAYERAESLGLPPKMLWYVYWPPAAYNNVGNHERAISLAGEQIATANTFGDMRYERGRAFEALDEIPQAIAEYERALSDDPDLTEAAEALQRLGAR